MENTEYCISAYLGVYNNEFELTYSIHSKKDFDNNFENVKSELIDIEKISNIQELEKIMKKKLGIFLVENIAQIEQLSKELDKDFVENENEECL